MTHQPARRLETCVPGGVARRAQAPPSQCLVLACGKQVMYVDKTAQRYIHMPAHKRVVTRILWTDSPPKTTSEPIQHTSRQARTHLCTTSRKTFLWKTCKKHWQKPAAPESVGGLRSRLHEQHTPHRQPPQPMSGEHPVEGAQLCEHSRVAACASVDRPRGAHGRERVIEVARPAAADLRRIRYDCVMPVRCVNLLALSPTRNGSRQHAHAATCRACRTAHQRSDAVRHAAHSERRATHLRQLCAVQACHQHARVPIQL